MESKRKETSPLRVYVSNDVGCESTHLEGLQVTRFLKLNGHTIVESPEDADFIVLNTCAFLPAHRRRVAERMQSFGELAPEAQIVVMGCAGDIAPELLGGNQTALICGHYDLHRLDRLFRREAPFEGTRYYHWSTQFDRVIISAGRGCVNNCSFCSIKKSTGHVRSRPVASILEDFRAAMAEGHQRFLLAADDLGSYGKDTGSDLPELLSTLGTLDQESSILLANIHPRWYLEYHGSVNAFLSSKHASKWLFLPIQSANQKVLESMNRDYSILAVGNALENLIREVPSIRLYYDILVGYPTETEEAFNDTLSFVMRYPPSYLTISRFSPEKDTPAAQLTPLEPDIVRSRVKWLQTIYGHAVKHNDRVPEGNWGEE